MYLLYALIMIVFHPAFIYPFGDEPFENSRFETVILADTQASLRVSNPSQDGTAVMYFMGNGGSLAYFGAHLSVHIDAGRQVLALDYPSGGGIPGQVSEARLKAQALDAYDWLSAFHGGPIIVHGYSLGTGLALHVAANRAVDGVILDAPYARMCELMTRASWLPACYLPGVQRWNSLGYADQIDAPVLVLQGTEDDLIPISGGLRLVVHLENAGQNVQFGILPGANHHNTALNPHYAAHINDFLSK
ncbi:alpha/beta hydrolase [Yoonia sp. I 8.24]|uniref:alpha/beta hydrolase n=1 Tax=Yoonia sp. I 8.24 TaxID=1537229 RepID=UPI001EE0601F|nr:alpha/beta hydrolase [Yoonia sp. I 8.24]MCG3267509.1 alpha/beta hydrolase [Yoonia sp. I 8.24]